MNDVTLPGRSAIEGEAEARRCALERLGAARAAGMAVSPLVGPAAAALGVAPRTLWRWLDEGLPGQSTSRAWQPAEADEDAYLRWKGNAAAAWRERRAAGGTPALRTFQAALARRFPEGERAALVEGVEGRRRHQVYLRWEPEARNELWETDHKELDVPVLFPRAQRPRKPWSTLFVDDYCGHGNFRNWASFTLTALDLSAEAGRDRLDEQVARNAFALLGGGVGAA